MPPVTSKSFGGAGGDQGQPIFMYDPTVPLHGPGNWDVPQNDSVDEFSVHGEESSASHLDKDVVPLDLGVDDWEVTHPIPKCLPIPTSSSPSPSQSPNPHPAKKRTKGPKVNHPNPDVGMIPSMEQSGRTCVARSASLSSNDQSEIVEIFETERDDPFMPELQESDDESEGDEPPSAIRTGITIEDQMLIGLRMGYKPTHPDPTHQDLTNRGLPRRRASLGVQVFLDNYKGAGPLVFDGPRGPRTKAAKNAKQHHNSYHAQKRSRSAPPTFAPTTSCPVPAPIYPDGEVASLLCNKYKVSHSHVAKSVLFPKRSASPTTRFVAQVLKGDVLVKDATDRRRNVKERTVRHRLDALKNKEVKGKPGRHRICM